MASVLPAMRGKFGSTEYYIVTMPAKELTERLVIPREIEGWTIFLLKNGINVTSTTIVYGARSLPI